MKKKTILKIVLIIIILILFLFSGIWYTKSIKKEYIKLSINKQKENNITTIDVTYIDKGDNFSHSCIFITNNDENEHWNECKLCGKKENIETHNFTTTWALGYETCLYTNMYTKTCKCGYSKSGKKPHVWDGSSYMIGSSYTHWQKCKVCQSYIFNDYYLYSYGNGNLIHDARGETCSKTDGTLMTCNNYGRCRYCGVNKVANMHSLICENNTITCSICKNNFGTYEYTVKTDNNTPVTYTIVTKINLSNGATYNSNVGFMSSQYYQVKNQTVSTTSSTQFTVTTVAKLISTYKYLFGQDTRILVNASGKNCYCTMPMIKNIPDLTEPTISSITLNDNQELTNWSRNKTILISGTENYCDIVRIKVIEVENEENIVFEGETTVNNQNYSISFTPEIEADEIGRKYKVIVTDTCNNSVEKEFTIAKVDCIPPTPTSEDSVNTEWSKEKLFTFSATDYGIGEVQIAFNNENEYGITIENENEFSRQYKFIGDVYEPKQAIALYKDGLGNISSKEITLNKLDNTAPSIVNAELYNNKLKITSHDKHEILGEGSGVVKYRYLASKQKLSNPEITNENSIEILKDEEIIVKDIYQMKYIYIIAEDLVRKYK